MSDKEFIKMKINQWMILNNKSKEIELEKAAIMDEIKKYDSNLVNSIFMELYTENK